MKTQSILSFFYYFLVISILTLSLSSCEDDKVEPDPEIPSGTLSDIDGNIYPIVEIGDQVWMASNLRTTKYRDGSVIDYHGNDILEWQNNTNGAYAWQNNDETNKDIYGGLYNWYAINNPNGLCPAGWRVSTAQDWNTMLKYLLDEHGCTNDGSGNKHAGNVLKSCRQVNSPMGEDCSISEHPRWDFHETEYGTDEFGFAALPGGIRNSQGSYIRIGPYGYFWTHDPINDIDVDAQIRSIPFDRSSVYGGWWQKIDKGNGLSVRCVKNI